MNIFKKSIHILSMLLWMGSPGFAAPIPLIKDDFESYVVDELLPKSVTETGGAYGYGAGAGQIYVMADWMSGLLGEGNQAIRIQKTASKDGSYLDALPIRKAVLTFDQLAAENLKLVASYDVNASSANTNQFYVALRSVSGSENFGTLFFKPSSQGTSAVLYSVAGEKEVDTGIRVPADVWHRVTCEVHRRPDGKWAFSASLMNKATGESAVLVDDALPALNSTDSPSFNRLRFYQFGSPAGVNVSYIDELSVFYTDEKSEPATRPLPPTPAPPAATGKIRILEQKAITDKKSGYVAWPTIAILPGGDLLVVASGGRIAHACPFGKCYLYRSTDLGKTWEGPTTLLDGKLDDRGYSLLLTSKGTLLAGGFASIVWTYYINSENEAPEREKILDYARQITLEDFRNETGFWMLRSIDGGITWSKSRAIADSPHGPCELDDGSLLSVGYEASSAANLLGGRPATGGLIAAKSNDDGLTWNVVSRIPVAASHRSYQYHEPHAVQANDGTIIVHIRKSYPKTAPTLQVTSNDRGLTWTQPKEVYWGYPSHLLKLKNGNILATYGYRRAPLGIRARVSSDNGKSWGDEVVLFDKGVSGDLGYPSTVELPDGSLLTVWYEKKSATETVLQSTHWEFVKNGQP